MSGLIPAFTVLLDGGLLILVKSSEILLIIPRKEKCLNRGKVLHCVCLRKCGRHLTSDVFKIKLKSLIMGQMSHRGMSVKKCGPKIQMTLVQGPTLVFSGLLYYLYSLVPLFSSLKWH